MATLLTLSSGSFKTLVRHRRSKFVQVSLCALEGRLIKYSRAPLQVLISRDSISSNISSLPSSKYIRKRILREVARLWVSWAIRFGLAWPLNPAFHNIFLCSLSRLNWVENRWDSAKESRIAKRLSEVRKGYIPCSSRCCSQPEDFSDKSAYKDRQ